MRLRLTADYEHFPPFVVAKHQRPFTTIWHYYIKNDVLAISLGGVLVTVIRFICHFISGATIWKEYAEGAPVLEYSFTYNAGYMFPELIITVVGLVVIAGVFDINSLELKTKKKSE